MMADTRCLDGGGAGKAIGSPSRWWPLIGIAFLCVMALWLFTRENAFPYFYHPDEPDKVDQVITEDWNFHHPLLMLGTAELVKKALHLPDQEQRIVIMGRWVSASFEVGAVLAFALLGWAVRGPAGSMVGALLATQHQVFELAHYLKEDTALLFAIGVAFLAIHFYWRRRDGLAAALAGGACGLCLSAKYLGAVMLVPALVIFIASQRRHGRRAAHCLLLVGGYVFVAVAVNWPMLLRFASFRHSLARETALVADPNTGFSGQVPIFEYVRMFVVNTNPVVWVLLIAEIVAHWLARRERDAFDWLMLAFPFAFTLLLSCSTKTNDRYFLPVTAGCYYLAALGALDLPRLLGLRGTRQVAVATAMLAGIFVWNLADTWTYLNAFAHDDRAMLLDAIRAQVPADATIAAEEQAELPNPDRPKRLVIQPLLAQKVMRVQLAAELGDTPGALAAKGIDYIVISESDYGRFFRKAAAHLKPDMMRKKEFYETLFSEAAPMTSFPRGTVLYLHPGLRLYALKGLK